ncbi:transglutaminase family protein [Sphingomonas histidinilytica]|uniref:transglutaminase family protein n=1 Tax=Rhizorhabdus histidinilytica TaxID=439228 RepID=UPI001ADB3BBB|nr:transglutaminase family protein [Rhizorhabdus histidinilytica]MBO9380106.1 transglutaminase family protein [Rhizorhabdus histidinilytica]
MKLGIRHRTRYRYRRPVTVHPHRLLAVPRDGAGLRLVEFVLDTGPDTAIGWSDDVFGNRVATIGFTGDRREVAIDASMVVELDAPAWPLFAIAVQAHRYPFSYEEDDRTDLGALAIPIADAAGDVTGFARGFVAAEPTDTLALLKDLNAGMLPRITYRPRDEEGTQSPAETLALGSGSCRDIAALFIACARSLRFGARAVSGYLHDPGQTAGGHGSTHAWAEVFLPGAGWVAFDPTHGRVGDAHLIPVAVARENRQIMPLTGRYAGSADDMLDMDVDVMVTAMAAPR